MKIFKLLGTALLAGLSFNATAGLLSHDGAGGPDVPVYANNDLVTGTYNIGSNLTFDDMFSAMKFTFLGKEAAHTNEFNFDGNQLLNTGAIGSSFTSYGVGTTGATDQVLDFNFYAQEPAAGVTNGSNFPEGAAQSFAIMLDYTHNGVFYDAVLLFDDSGAGPDDNHDDMMIGVNAYVPEPGSIALLSLGLIGLGVSRRRTK